MDSNSTLWTSGPHPPSTYTEVVTVAPTIFPRIGYNILSYLMFINTLLSVFNNGIVITVMLRNPSLLQPINVFILSLAVSDLMIGLCGSLVVTITNYQGSFFIGHAACVFQGFAVNYFGKLSLVCNVFVCAWRCFVSWLKHNKIKSEARISIFWNIVSLDLISGCILALKCQCCQLLFDVFLFFLQFCCYQILQMSCSFL